MADRLTDDGNAYCPLVSIHKVGSNSYSKDAKIVRDNSK